MRLFIVVWLAVCPALAQTDAFKIRVTDSTTSAPIAGANVTLSQAERSGAGDRVSGRTDTGGIFAGRTSPGIAMLTVTRHGYRMTGFGMGMQVEVKPGAANEMEVEMLPLGVIAGRVVDQYGDPVRNAIVHVEDPITSPNGDQSFESFGAATVDDRGEYRVDDVEPGKHYLAVEFNSTVADRDSGIRSNLHWPQTGGLVLFPGASGFEQAEQIDVTGGAALRLADIHLRIQRAVTVSGHVQPAGASPPQILLKRTEELSLHSSPSIQSIGVDADGSFRMEVLPGKYFLSAADNKSGKVSKAIALDLNDKDVSDLELALTSGYEIRGHIAVKGREGIDFANLVLNFGGPALKIDASGNFQTNVMASKVTYFLQNLPDHYFIENVSVAGKKTEGQQFSVEPGVNDVVLTLNPRGASASILPQGAGADGVVTVVLLPTKGGTLNPELIPHAEPDDSGRFSFHSVPPGSYRVFMLDASSYLMMLRPDVLLDKNKDQAPLISLGEDEHKELTLPVMKVKTE